MKIVGKKELVEKEKGGERAMQFVADLKFRGNDAECERLYNEYKKAKANLMGYLTREGIDFSLELEKKKTDETASGS